MTIETQRTDVEPRGARFDRAYFGTPMLDVTSSNVGRIGYDEGTRRLYVQFRDKRADSRDGTVYEYEDVPEDVFEELMAQEELDDGSVGTAFHRIVKSVGYGCRRIR